MATPQLPNLGVRADPGRPLLRLCAARPPCTVHSAFLAPASITCLLRSSPQNHCPRIPRAMSSTPALTSTPPAANDLVQYVMVRTDLGWSTGALVAQGIHATVTATHPETHCAHTAAYVAPRATGQMTTLVLAAKSGETLQGAADTLHKAVVRCALWKEQPENVVTALASRPGTREELKPHFKAFRLLR